jgi:predicted transcriptional regulator
MQVKKYMVPLNDLVRLRPGDTVERAAERMYHYDVGSVIIGQDEILGIVTTGDMMKVIASHKSAGLSKTMEHIMSTDLITIDKDKPTNVAIQMMEASDIHHLLVTDENDEIVGLISSYDLVREKSLDIKAHPWIRK